MRKGGIKGLMEPSRLSSMDKADYDRLISSSFLCRIAFNGDSHPHIAPFIYVFDGRFMYFLSSRYGQKMEHFHRDPRVTVEVEHYLPDMSSYSFVILSGKLEEVTEIQEAAAARQGFIEMIQARKLSPQVLHALGYSPEDSLEVIRRAEVNVVWKLVKVKSIKALRSSLRTP